MESIHKQIGLLFLQIEKKLLQLFEVSTELRLNAKQTHSSALGRLQRARACKPDVGRTRRRVQHGLQAGNADGIIFTRQEAALCGAGCSRALLVDRGCIVLGFGNQAAQQLALHFDPVLCIAEACGEGPNNPIPNAGHNDGQDRQRRQF